MKRKYSYSVLTYVYLLSISISSANSSYVSDERLPSTLWEPYADQILKECEQAGDEMVICLVRFVKIKSYKGIHFILLI